MLRWLRRRFCRHERFWYRGKDERLYLVCVHCGDSRLAGVK